MLEYLSKKVRLCMQKAKRAPKSSMILASFDFLDMERRWLKLARSYQFSEQLDTFHKHNKK